MQTDGMRELALFAGAGGGILAGKLLGWRTVCAVEINPFCARRLMQRQNEGHLPPFPIWDDVRTFNGRSWRGFVDVVSAGFPCQDISICGTGEGIDGERSGLWTDTKDIIRDVRPSIAWLENSPMLTSRGLGRVLGDLAEMGFHAEWGVLGANATGMDHERERIWILAHSDSNRRERQSVAGNSYETCRQIIQRCSAARGNDKAWTAAWRRSQPGIQRVANGMAVAVERHRAIGNGQVPRVAATAFLELASRFE